MRTYSVTNNYAEIIQISLNSIEKAKEFCHVVGGFHADIDIMQGNHISDAKSIMAIFSYDLTTPILVGIITGYDPELQKFKKEMEKYKWEG
jgi:phosphocarrier protein HPr